MAQKPGGAGTPGQCRAFCLGKAGNFRQEAVMNKKRENDRLWKVWLLLYCTVFYHLSGVPAVATWINTFYYSTLSYYKRN
ncbi:MAG: hypothetical protein ACLU9T_11130 [Blautia faecis]